ncbi:hypothetical protein DIPPA_24250 [Diplonema papillatum]|nr:hypothetical protein DIPPA_24250 [Diplonema papillatum]
MRALLLCTALATLFVAPSQGETILAFLSTSQQLKRFYELVLGVEEVRDALSRMQFGYTVFAPTNEAILRFMTPGIQGLLQKDPEALRKLVAYHVAVSQDVIRTVNIPVTHAGMVTSLYGSKILVERSANGFRVNSRAHIEQPDTILESLRTGCVHVVDQVLTYPGWFPDDDLVTLFRKPDDIRAFYATIWEAKEELGLNEQGPITVFVPSNSAFAREGLSTKGITLSTLLEEDRKLFIRILKYHIVHSKYLTGADLAQPSYAQTLDVHQGKASYVVFQKDATGAIDINNGEAKISKPAGVPALNGVYYIIDHLLLPTGVAVPDVNYSVARQEGLQAALASAETPEPLPELVLEVNTKRSDKKVHAHKLPLVLLFLVLAALLLYRVAVPAPDLLSKKAQNRQQKADGCLLVFGAFVLIMFLLPGTSWMLPPALKWTSEEVRATVSRMVSGTTTSVSPVAKDQTDITEARDREGKLRDLLHSLTYDMYRHQLVAYGLDRVELIAMATPLDGQRAGIKQAHWSNLVHQARIRSPMTEPDFTPPPPEQARVPMDARTPTPPDLSHAQILVKEFEKEEGARMTPSPQSVYHPVAKPVTPPPVFVDPEAGLKKFVLAYAL